MTTPALAVGEVAEAANSILDEVERAVVGKREPLRLILMALLANGHVLIEDLPGLAKSLLARSFAQVADMGFSRVQFTPDLMPMDITGSMILDPATNAPEFRPGPVFTNLLLADEINRAPAKTQASLLEAMQERQVTVDGTTHLLGPPFLVIATQNPIEYEGTYPLPEAQVDRFLARVRLGYPDREAEWTILESRAQRGTDEIQLRKLVDRSTVLAMQRAIESVHVAESVGKYIVDLVSATRASGRVRVGASPRGSLAVMKLARASAAFAGRDYVTPDDIQDVAVAGLAHRIIMRPEFWAQEFTEERVVNEILEQIETPPALPNELMP
ncbi:MAG TPA: MoxR family ATPase [Acidimicrobiia bacterium]|nr:MoxR family ATPase [Acidimicrobiia bacterium]